MRLSTPLRLLSGLTVAVLALAALIVGVARAAQAMRPAGSPTSIAALRGLADHYRAITWTYERAAGERRTPTSFSYRRSADRGYLQWTIDAWTRRAYESRKDALVRIHRKLAVRLPAGPGLRSSLAERLRYERELALRLHRIYPGAASRSFASATGPDPHQTLRLWQERSAEAALAVALHAKPQLEAQVPPALARDFACIHRYEGGWTDDTGNGYYGGLQMDIGFQSRYGSDFLRRWGTADHWPAWAQIQAAVRAYRSGRGFWPWPNTARDCGLL